LERVNAEPGLIGSNGAAKYDITRAHAGAIESGAIESGAPARSSQFILPEAA
jgi:hypothetical protein